MTIDPNEIKVINNADEKRFEVRIGKHAAVAEYMRAGDRIIFTHTEVPKELEGNGIAGKLARTGLEFAREQKLKVMPLCPYVAGYIRRHPEYRELLLEGFNV